MLNKFKAHIDQNFPYLKESKLLLAISGGLDSVVLMHLCLKSNLNISLAHCNFNLRAAESDADEAFVIQLAEAQHLEVFVESFKTKAYAQQHKLSTQLAARALRYDWFKELIGAFQFDYLLTAHHADDNLETFLINLSRGTGLEGLTGIPEKNDHIIRPLLPFSRQELEAYAQEYELVWREDSSNASDAYLRNQIRHHVVPELKKLNPEFLQNVINTQKHLEESQWLIEDRIDDVFEEVVDTVSEDGIYFNIEKLRALSHPKAYLFEMLKEYGFTNWSDVTHLLEAQTGKQVFASEYVLLKNRDHLILSKIQLSSTETRLISESEIGGEVATEIGVMSIDLVGHIEEMGNHILYVDKDLLKFPLTVRSWEKGDYFYPFGMQGKKKISKFLKDEKLSLRTKQKTYVLCSDDQIVWVINKRADDRYKVTKTTKQILKIKFC